MRNSSRLVLVRNKINWLAEASTLNSKSRLRAMADAWVSHGYRISSFSPLSISRKAPVGFRARPPKDVKAIFIVIALLFINILPHHPFVSRNIKKPKEGDPRLWWRRKNLNNKYSFGFHYQPTEQRRKNIFSCPALSPAAVAIAFDVDAFWLGRKLVIPIMCILTPASRCYFGPINRLIKRDNDSARRERRESTVFWRGNWAMWKWIPTMAFAQIEYEFDAFRC